MVPTDLQEHPGQVVHQALVVHQVVQGQVELLVRQELAEQVVHLGQEGLQELQVQVVLQVQMDLQGLAEVVVVQVHQERVDLTEVQEQVEAQGQVEVQEQVEHRVQAEHQELAEHQEQEVLQVHLDQVELQVLTDLQVQVGFLQ